MADKLITSVVDILGLVEHGLRIRETASMVSRINNYARSIGILTVIVPPVSAFLHHFKFKDTRFLDVRNRQ